MPTSESQIGRVTIDLLGLNRDELVQRRRDRLITLFTLRQAYLTITRQTGDNPSTEMRDPLRTLKSLLDDAITDSAEYAAMARVALG